MRITKTHIYFWSDYDYLSNFYPSKFIVDNYIYRFNEEYIMRQKALLFKDYNSEVLIRTAQTPYQIKKIGRNIINFNETIWLENRDRILYEGLMEKFLQNNNLKELLINTNDKYLVEASKYDKIYGVGLEESDDKILNSKNWLGQNLLGEILMKVRRYLIKID